MYNGCGPTVMWNLLTGVVEQFFRKKLLKTGGNVMWCLAETEKEEKEDVGAYPNQGITEEKKEKEEEQDSEKTGRRIVKFKEIAKEHKKEGKKGEMKMN